MKSGRPVSQHLPGGLDGRGPLAAVTAVVLPESMTGDGGLVGRGELAPTVDIPDCNQAEKKKKNVLSFDF